MKTLLTIIVLFFFGATFAQETTKIDTTTFKIGQNTVLIVNKVYDNIKYDYNLNHKDSLCLKSKTQNQWPKLSIDFGSNGYLSSKTNFDLPENQKSFRLNYGRSRSFGSALYFKGYESQNKHFHISPGIGLTWNSYHFDENVKITNSDNQTRILSDTSLVNKKYKLRVSYLEFPLIIGTNIGKGKNHLVLQVGGIAGIKIGSIIKQKFHNQGLDHNDRIVNDFNLNPFKFDCIARLSIGNIGLFARYSITTLFENNKAPTLHPFAVGLSLNSF